MKTAVITLSDSGTRAAELLIASSAGWTHVPLKQKGGLRRLVREAFTQYDGLVFVMACGIAVRMIAELIQDKYHDPAIVVVDDAWRHAVSILSGHEGGANELTYQVSAVLGCESVVSTASEVNKDLVLGIGCRRNLTAEEIISSTEEFARTEKIDPNRIRIAATINLKKRDTGLRQAMQKLSLPLVFIPEARINSTPAEFTESAASMRQIGVKAVAEPCALLAGRNADLIIPKRIHGSVTFALVREKLHVEEKQNG